MAGRIVLGPNQYGKAEVRLVKITRDTFPDHPGRHLIEDLNVTTQLRGDFEACHTEGDNSQVVATDTQKNTVYAFARQFGVALTRAAPADPRGSLRRGVPVGQRWALRGRAVRLGADQRR